MKAINVVQTNDGVTHKDLQSANKHLIKMRDQALWKIAESVWNISVSGGHKSYAIGMWLLENISLLKELVLLDFEIKEGLKKEEQDDFDF